MPYPDQLEHHSVLEYLTVTPATSRPMARSYSLVLTPEPMSRCAISWSATASSQRSRSAFLLVQ